jgi:hypothetical protein
MPMTCQACGRPLASDVRGLSPIQRAILDTVTRRGEISARDLADIVWADDPGGGPLSGVKQHIFYLNRKLRPYGLAVRAGRGAGAVYSLRTNN